MPDATIRRIGLTLAMLAPALAAAGCGTIDRAFGVSTACDLRPVGVPAQAEVLSLWDTGWTINEDPVVGLRVLLLAGDRAPFEAEIPKAWISRLEVSRLQVGQRVPVVFAADDPSRVGLDIYPCN